MVFLNEGDKVEVLEADGSIRIKGTIVKKETIGFVSPSGKKAEVKQVTDLILDSGARIRKILYQYPE